MARERVVWRRDAGNAAGLVNRPVRNRAGLIGPAFVAVAETFGPETFGPETFGPETFGPETFGPETFDEDQAERVFSRAGFQC